MFSVSDDGAFVLDLIALAILIASGVYVASASSRSELARGRRLLAAGIAPLLVGLWVLWRLGDARSLWFSLIVGVACALTAVLASVVRTRAARGDDPVRALTGRTRWASVGLIVVRFGLLSGALVAVVVLLVGGGLERRIDDRVRIEQGYLAPGDPDGRRWQDRTTEWYGDMVRLQLAVDSPVGGTLCPEPVLEVNRVTGRPVARERLSDCPIADDVRAEYGGDPVGVKVYKLVVNPPASVGRKINAVIATGFLLTMLAGLAIERLLARAARRRPFDRSAVTWVRLFIGAIAGLSIGLPVAADLLVRSLVQEYLPALPTPGVSLSAWPVLFVLLLLALAEVWRYGISLQEDAEATV